MGRLGAYAGNLRLFTNLKILRIMKLKSLCNSMGVSVPSFRTVTSGDKEIDVADICYWSSKEEVIKEITVWKKPSTVIDTATISVIEEGILYLRGIDESGKPDIDNPSNPKDKK